VGEGRPGIEVFTQGQKSAGRLEVRGRKRGSLGGSGVYEQLVSSEACDNDDVDRIRGHACEHAGLRR
jgi:hypothetical protein